ncbi:hypothetical protein [Leclercia sp.]|uniref:hypothetical protein n=1 Tax=Leclercia sp. TaxID=1898428 RepID=UPI002FDD2A88
MIYIKFKDEKQKEIVSVFLCEQSSDYYKNLDEVSGEDKCYLAFIEAHPEE